MRESGQEVFCKFAYEIFSDSLLGKLSDQLNAALFVT
jgi:hypothetical protein